MRKLLIACTLALFAGAALASPPVEEATAAKADTAAADADDAVKVAKDDRNCIRHTGSRIKTKDKDRCLPVAGRSYSREDIDATGATDVADALSRLDPAIRRGGH